MYACVVRQRSSFWSSMLKNGLPIRWTWVGESWQLPVKNCTFSTESAHSHTHQHNTWSYSNNNQTNYILSSSLALSRSAHSPSLSRSIYFFIFLLPSHFISSFSRFSFPYRYLYFAYAVLYVFIYSIARAPARARSLCLYHICYFSISGRFISHGNKQRFQLKKNYPFQQLNLKLWYAPNWAKKTWSEPN